MHLPETANSYQQARALTATLFHAALLIDAEGRTAPRPTAMFAVQSAEALLAELGIVDPDTVT